MILRLLGYAVYGLTFITVIYVIWGVAIALWLS